MSDIPHFAYPGGKARLATRIVSLFPSVGDRFVDVFAGRGNITWAVMSLLNYRKYWINAVGTIGFFNEIAAIGSLPFAGEYLFQDRTKQFYEKSKAYTVGVRLKRIIPKLEWIAAHPKGNEAPFIRKVVKWLKGAHGEETVPGIPKFSDEELRQPASPTTEGYVSRDGGTFDSTGPRVGAGITKKGVSRLFYEAGLLLEQNWKRTKLTSIDYRDVLARCTARDMVYL